MRVMVTGGAGYVGIPLCKKLKARGHDVVALDNLACGEERAETLARTGARLVRADLTKPGEARDAVLDIAPEGVLHLAAIHFIPECNRRPVDAVRVNVIGTERLLAACTEAASVRRVIVTSSAAVYPITDRWSREDDPVGPTDIYGITKATNERQASDFAAATGKEAAAVRLFNVFGPGETNPHVVPEVVAQLKRGASELRLGNVTPKRSYVYVDDVAEGFASLLEAKLPDRFAVANLGVREEASVEEIVGLLSEMLRRPIAILRDKERERPVDRPFLRCDPSRMRELTGFEARTSIREGLGLLLQSEGMV